jgi:hypothetical protein
VWIKWKLAIEEKVSSTYYPVAPQRAHSGPVGCVVARLHEVERRRRLTRAGDPDVVVRGISLVETPSCAVFGTKRRTPLHLVYTFENLWLVDYLFFENQENIYKNSRGSQPASTRGRPADRSKKSTWPDRSSSLVRSMHPSSRAAHAAAGAWLGRRPPPPRPRWAAGTGAAPYADVSFVGRLSRPVSAFNLSVFLRSEIYGRPGGPAWFACIMHFPWRSTSPASGQPDCSPLHLCAVAAAPPEHGDGTGHGMRY